MRLQKFTEDFQLQGSWRLVGNLVGFICHDLVSRTKIPKTSILAVYTK